jgi:hypothetical protein
MPPLEQLEKEALAAAISKELSATPFACSSLTALNGGTTNFVFRGLLAEPSSAQDGRLTTSVIVKYSTDFVAVNRGFPLDISRCVRFSLLRFPMTFRTMI